MWWVELKLNSHRWKPTLLPHCIESWSRYRVFHVPLLVFIDIFPFYTDLKSKKPVSVILHLLILTASLLLVFYFFLVFRTGFRLALQTVMGWVKVELASLGLVTEFSFLLSSFFWGGGIKFVESSFSTPGLHRYFPVLPDLKSKKPISVILHQFYRDCLTECDH